MRIPINNTPEYTLADIDRKRKELLDTRKTILIQMNDFIINDGDEELYEIWFTEGLPDTYYDEDIAYIINSDTEWADICDLFGEIYKLMEERDSE